MIFLPVFDLDAMIGLLPQSSVLMGVPTSASVMRISTPGSGKPIRALDMPSATRSLLGTNGVYLNARHFNVQVNILIIPEKSSPPCPSAANFS